MKHRMRELAPSRNGRSQAVLFLEWAVLFLTSAVSGAGEAGLDLTIEEKPQVEVCAVYGSQDAWASSYRREREVQIKVHG
jgi:hypothetical protein